MVVDERIRLILRFVVIGAGYGYWTSIAAAAGLRGLMRGALTGVLIGAAVSSLRAFLALLRHRHRRSWLPPVAALAAFHLDEMRDLPTVMAQ